MGRITLTNLQPGDTYRALVGYGGNNYTLYPTRTAVIDRANVDYNNSDVITVVVSRIGFEDLNYRLVGDYTVTISPNFNIPIPGVTYEPSGLNIDDYIQTVERGTGVIGDSDAVIQRDMYDGTLSDGANIQQNVDLWCEYAHTIPSFIFKGHDTNDAPPPFTSLIKNLADDILHLNFGSVITNPTTKTIPVIAYAHHPVSYTDNIAVGHKKIPISKISPRTAQYRIAKNAHEHTTFPSDLHYYLLQLISSGVNNLPAPQKIIITEYITSGPDVAKPYYKKVGELRPPIITRTIDGDDAICTFVDNTVDSVLQDGKTYYIGIADGTLPQLSGPILYDTTQTAGHGGIEMGTYQDQGNDFITFRLHRDYHNLDADANTKNIINHIKSGSGTLPIGTIIDILNKPDVDGNATHFETITLQSVAVFNEYNPTTEHYGASLELGLGESADFQDKVLGFRIPVNSNVSYNEYEPILLAMPVVYNDERVSRYLIFKVGAASPDELEILKEIRSLVTTNQALVSHNSVALSGIDESIDEMRKNIADSEYDSYTGATVTHHIPIHDHISGDRIYFDNVTLVKSIFGKFGSPVPTPITLTIQKLDGDNLVGDVLHTQTFDSPFGSLGEELTIELDTTLELEPGEYAFGYVSGETAACFGTQTLDANNPGNAKLRWRAGDTSVLNENGVYTAVKIIYDEKLRLGSILDPTNKLLDFQDGEVSYTTINENHRRVELHKGGDVVATWNEIKSGDTWTRDHVVRT